LFISHSAHHRHSYYIVRNAQLLGFTDWEQMVIAFVARYHRKSPPRKSHLEFQSLLPPQQALVSQLAGMLRIADGLDRTHVSAVKSVRVKSSGKKLQFILTPSTSEAVQYSIWGAERKKDMFEEVFQKEIEFMVQ
jgi:exopolyphosphatase/guanosine-5'-triphosphate,3'-diphosphate pyrophosphatase